MRINSTQTKRQVSVQISCGDSYCQVAVLPRFRCCQTKGKKKSCPSSQIQEGMNILLLVGGPEVGAGEKPSSSPGSVRQSLKDAGWLSGRSRWQTSLKVWPQFGPSFPRKQRVNKLRLFRTTGKLWGESGWIFFKPCKRKRIDLLPHNCY